MKAKLLTLSALVACLCCAAIAFSFTNFSRSQVSPFDARDAVPGKLFAYRLDWPFNDMNAAALEIRRVSSPVTEGRSVGSVNANLRISKETAGMITLTGLISSLEIHEEVAVSVYLLELDDILAESSAYGEWAIAGQIKRPGVSSKISPSKGFCRGGMLSTVWEPSPRWEGNEICVGRFRSRDEDQIYDYYCVVIARNTEKP